MKDVFQRQKKWVKKGGGTWKGKKTEKLKGKF